MTYQVSFLRRAQKELSDLPVVPYTAIRDAIRALANDPRPSGCRKLTGRDGWRIRVGNFRVLYDIDDTQQTVTVIHIGNRRDVYR